MFKKTIEIKYHVPIQELEQTKLGDWIDLRAAKDTFIKPGHKAKVPFGVSMKLPRNHEAHVAPRSSLFKNFGVLQTDGVGVIDESYCGNDDEWFAELYNPGTETAFIQFNARICQFRIIKKMPKTLFKRVYSLSSQNRGGHGSSGIL